MSSDVDQVEDELEDDDDDECEHGVPLWEDCEDCEDEIDISWIWYDKRRRTGHRREDEAS